MEHWGMGAAASLGAALSSRVETCWLSIEAIFFLFFFLPFSIKFVLRLDNVKRCILSVGSGWTHNTCHALNHSPRLCAVSPACSPGRA